MIGIGIMIRSIDRSGDSDKRGRDRDGGIVIGS